MANVNVPFKPSTNISEIFYDRDTQTLTIYFQKGGAYEYYEVDETTVNGFENAFSATKYMNSFIQNVFPGQRSY